MEESVSNRINMLGAARNNEGSGCSRHYCLCDKNCHEMMQNCLPSRHLSSGFCHNFNRKFLGSSKNDVMKTVVEILPM